MHDLCDTAGLRLRSWCENNARRIGIDLPPPGGRRKTTEVLRMANGSGQQKKKQDAVQRKWHKQP
jgi:hypothetical protein